MSSLTIAIGDPGAGKTSWIIKELKEKVRKEGQRRQRLSTAQIEVLNRTRKHPLTPPSQFPIYTNFPAQFRYGYEKVFKPYYMNEAFFGLPNKGKPVIPVVPWSVVALQEMDDEYNSRERGLMVKSVTGLYNKRRHWNLDIYMDLHRLMILDSIIRKTATRVIEVLSCKHEKDYSGRRVLKTTWQLREFTNIDEAQKYAATEGREGKYTEREDTYEGDIFKCYDTQSCASEFVPDEGDDFIYLSQPLEVDKATLPPEFVKFYSKKDESKQKGVKQNVG